MNTQKTLLALSLTGLLAACGGGSSDSSQTGTFSLGVSDSPTDASIVNIAFKQVVLKNEEGAISFDVSEDGGLKHVNLLEYQGTAYEALVSGQEIPVGEYQMCIYMENDETGAAGTSYVERNESSIEGLVTNSNGSCGGAGAEDPNTGRLFFNKKFVIAAGNNAFMAEFNLMQGLQDFHGNKDYWTLKPTAVQMVNVAEVGAIAGTLPQSVMDDCAARASDLGDTSQELMPAVYLYPGKAYLEQDDLELTKQVMVDFRLPEDVSPGEDGVAAAEVAPYAAAYVTMNDDGSYGYEFGFVVGGEYSLGYTCVTQNDDPQVANNEDSTRLEGEAQVPAPFFLDAAQQGILVSDGNTTMADFVGATE